MKLKKQQAVALILAIVGAALFISTFLFTMPETMFLRGVASGVFAAGAVRFLSLCRTARNAERAAEFEAAFTDERVAYITSKARAATLSVSIFVELIGGFVARFALKNELLSSVLFYLACFQLLLYCVFYFVYSRKS